MTIISKSNGFIFIKTRKTAGTSIEVELAQRCGTEDIVTPILPANPVHRPRNYRAGSDLFYNHMPAREVLGLVGDALYRSAYKFCVERHPVDKCLSCCGMLINSALHRSADTPRSWDEYVERGIFPVDDHLYTDDRGRLIVDEIYRFDELPSRWTQICRRLGVSVAPLAAREKTGLRKGTPSLAEAMANRAQVNRIMDAFAGTAQHISWH